jgi:hypothetical protein
MGIGCYGIVIGNKNSCMLKKILKKEKYVPRMHGIYERDGPL